MRTVGLAKRLRRELSLPEVLLWRELRKRPAGLKFRRQHPAGDFVLDFYCAAARLAIEVDGATHDRLDRAQRDERRDAWLATRGVYVVRIPVATIMKDVGQAIDMIIGSIAPDHPLHRPSDGPPPHTGEDL